MLSRLSAPRVVLVVDDNAAMRALICSVVRATGPVVHECADGESAVELYARVHPDVVLMDLKMTGMGGLAATRAIRRADPGARIVIVSEMADAGSRAAAADAGASEFVPKQDLLELPALLAQPGREDAGGAA